MKHILQFHYTSSKIILETAAFVQKFDLPGFFALTCLVEYTTLSSYSYPPPHPCMVSSQSVYPHTFWLTDTVV